MVRTEVASVHKIYFHAELKKKKGFIMKWLKRTKEKQRNKL